MSLQLLKEMGTVRNVRSLKLQNDRLAALSKGTANMAQLT
jgi:hypothetical protein